MSSQNNNQNRNSGNLITSDSLISEQDVQQPVARKTAVALSYTKGEEAPKIVATGKGLVAERIIEQAQEYDVPLYEDGKLASTLSALEIGDMIPPELYEVVAEILVFVDKMDRIRSKVM